MKMKSYMNTIKMKSLLFDGFLAGWTSLFSLGVLAFWLVGSPRKAIRATTPIRTEAYCWAELCREGSRFDAGRTLSHRLQSSIHLGNAGGSGSLPGRRNRRETRTAANSDYRLVPSKITDDHH